MAGDAGVKVLTFLPCAVLSGSGLAAEPAGSGGMSLQWLLQLLYFLYDPASAATDLSLFLNLPQNCTSR